MTATYTIAPEPVWILINLVGTVAGGGYITTTESLNKTVQKPVFQDPAGTEAWPNPTYFDLNGVQGPFYWEFDPDFPDDTYFVQAFDAEGNLLWEIDGFTGSSGGGGGNVTEYIATTNYIANNVFIDAIDDTANPIALTNLVIAPSNHDGFTPALLNPVVTSAGVVGPDIRFVKNNTAATDQIKFPVFTLGDVSLSPDVTPVSAVEYICTNSPVGEDYKAFQFPICQKVQNLSNQIVTFKVWAKVAVTPVELQLYTLQYFGSGTGATAPIRLQQGLSFTLTTSWAAYYISFTVPNVATFSLGTPGHQTDDDALYLQLQMPLGTPCDVFFTKPCLFLGENIEPTMEFETYDQINSINSTFRTGDIKTSLSSQAPLGWVAMNDGSIGNVGSSATNRANQDTFQLYKTIWDGVLDAWAPVATGRGATAIADFLANKALTLPRSLGRALAGAGTGAGLTARVLGQYVGSQTISISAMPSHNHSLGNQLQFAAPGIIQGGPGYNLINTVTGSTGGGSGGQGAADGNMEPTSFMNVFIKL